MPVEARVKLATRHGAVAEAAAILARSSFLDDAARHLLAAHDALVQAARHGTNGRTTRALLLTAEALRAVLGADADRSADVAGKAAPAGAINQP